MLVVKSWHLLRRPAAAALSV